MTDTFDAKTGQATSIKTYDWNTSSRVNDPSPVESQIKAMVNKLVNYDGTLPKSIVGDTNIRIAPEDIQGKTLELTLYANGGTPAQVAAVNRAIDYANQNGVQVTVVKAR